MRASLTSPPFDDGSGVFPSIMQGAVRSGPVEQTDFDMRHTTSPSQGVSRIDRAHPSAQISGKWRPVFRLPPSSSESDYFESDHAHSESCKSQRLVDRAGT